MGHKNNNYRNNDNSRRHRDEDYSAEDPHGVNTFKSSRLDPSVVKPALHRHDSGFKMQTRISSTRDSSVILE